MCPLGAWKCSAVASTAACATHNAIIACVVSTARRVAETGQVRGSRWRRSFGQRFGGSMGLR